MSLKYIFITLIKYCSSLVFNNVCLYADNSQVLSNDLLNLSTEIIRGFRRGKPATATGGGLRKQRETVVKIVLVFRK